MWKRYVQPIRSENFWRSTNRERVILPSSQAKLRKNALFIDQSVFSNFALYVIIDFTVLHACAQADYFYLSIGNQGAKEFKGFPIAEKNHLVYM